MCDFLYTFISLYFLILSFFSFGIIKCEHLKVIRSFGKLYSGDLHINEMFNCALDSISNKMFHCYLLKLP